MQNAQVQVIHGVAVGLIRGQEQACHLGLRHAAVERRDPRRSARTIGVASQDVFVKCQDKRRRIGMRLLVFGRGKEGHLHGLSPHAVLHRRAPGGQAARVRGPVQDGLIQRRDDLLEMFRRVPDGRGHLLHGTAVHEELHPAAQTGGVRGPAQNLAAHDLHRLRQVAEIHPTNQVVLEYDRPEA